MSYTNAEEILPPELIREIQKFIQGSQIYIPRNEEKRLGWGMKNGTREMLEQRNRQIKSRKADGWSLDQLADQYHLSLDTIRKILYTKRDIPEYGEMTAVQRNSA